MSQQNVQARFGNLTVPVVPGGYYDRFGMNPDLDEIERDPAAGNIDFFRRVPKQLVASRVGPTWAPNFYYRTRSAQLLMQAPLANLRSHLPEPLEPLSPLPGIGLVALTLFSYAVCDNDPYDEASVAVLIRRPGSRQSTFAQLVSGLRRRSFHAHVLALPVTTEVARIRGVEGYQLPKYRANIGLDLRESVSAHVASMEGRFDLRVHAPLPAVVMHIPQSRTTSTTMVHRVDGTWHQTQVTTNVLASGSRLRPSGVKLERGHGPLTQLLSGLGAGSIWQLDVVADAQVVLNMPVPLPALRGC